MRAPDAGRVRCLLLLLAATLLCTSASADDKLQKKLHAIERALTESRQQQANLAKQADELGAELAALREESVAAARSAQEHEAALTALEARLAALTATERAKTAELARSRAQQVRLLMALERLAASPPEGLLLTPGTPVDALRGALLMGAAVPPIEQRAQTLRNDLDALAALKTEIAQTEADHRRERDALQAEEAQVAALVERKAALQQAASRGVEDSRRREAKLAADAVNLRELIDRLEKQQQERAEEDRRKAAALAAPEVQATAPRTQTALAAPPPPRPDSSKPHRPRPFAQARGTLVIPAAGQLVRRYGEPDELGLASHGLTFETRPGAQVVAPFDGQVLFAGPFRGYGQILIIGHGDGYHSLLAGLDRVDSSVGQWLVAGEPVGVMAGGAEKPRLYFELRHDNQPINPLPWLATHAEKVNG